MDVWKEIFKLCRGPTGDDQMWAVRNSLMRLKPLTKVIPNLNNPDEPAIGTLLDKELPPANPFDCACDVCFRQYFPATLEVSDVEARHIISSLVAGTRQDYDFLRQVLADHADFLVTRWKKKSREKRSMFLSKNADLYNKKWAAVHLLHMRSNQDCNFSKYKDTWLLPYLDSDMLAEDPTLLLGLLHFRILFEPEKWILFDNLHVDLAERFPVISQTFNPHCVVVQGPDFGQLVDWNAAQAHRYEIIGFTKAHCILLAQQRMMAFLRKCVAGLLDEANEPPVLQSHPKWNHLIETNFSRSDPAYAWSTESVRPFSSPPTFDPSETVETIRSRHRVVKDHLEQLQTDPAYVQLHARQIKSALFFETFRNEDVWPYLVDQLFRDTLLRECYWRQLIVESERMMVAWQAYVNSPSEATRTAYDQSMICVQMYCVESFAVFERHVDASLLGQRGFERNFTFEGDGRRHRLNRRFSTRDFFPEDILYWSISCLGHDQYRPFTMDPSLNFAVIDYLCRTDVKEAERLDQNLLDQLSDMSVLNSIINNVRCCVSHDRHRKPEFLAIDKRLREDFVRKINSPAGDASNEIGDFAAKYLDDFYNKHPWPKGKKDSRWLEQDTASRGALDRFWEAFRGIRAKKLRANGVKSSTIDEDMDVLSAAKAERHLAELAAERDEIHHLEFMRRTEKNNQSSTAADVQTVWGKEDDSSPLLSTRTKTKRRQESATSAESAQQPSTAQDTDYQPPSSPNIIGVKHDNMPVFMHMYPSCGEESQRCFSWQHFLSAMIDAGFSIFQSQGGAVTLRLNEDRGGVRTIVVHRPHPSSSINPVMLRSIAKRMTKWFGWKREVFIERGKKKEEGKGDAFG